MLPRGIGAGRVKEEGKNIMKKVIIALALSSGFILSGCNAVRGAAADVESVGDCVDGKQGNC
jgi:predicted small secreted protein